MNKELLNNSIKEMNQQEIKEALTMLKKLVKNGVFTIAPESTQDLKGFCYISTQDIKGVYFPNTIIKQDKTPANHTHPLYNFLCLCNNNGVLSVAYVLKDYDDLTEKEKKLYNALSNYYKNYVFESLESLYYTYDELNAIDKLNKNINYINDELKILYNIKYITKKDGSNFKDLLKNINPEPNENTRITASFNYSFNGEKNSLTLKMAIIHANFNSYYNITLYNSNFNSLDKIKTAVKNAIESRENDIKEYKNDIKNIKKTFDIVRAFKNNISKCNLTATTKEAIKEALRLL